MKLRSENHSPSPVRIGRRSGARGDAMLVLHIQVLSVIACACKLDTPENPEGCCDPRPEDVMANLKNHMRC